MVREFIEGWDLMQILGEGSFAEVKLLVNRETGEACAMKEVDLDNHPDQAENTRKEICVHKLLKHVNVVQCYGSRRLENHSRQFIFLEYCSGGELFDRIEPEVGMAEHQAQYYFNQLIAGLEYLHQRGVAHRDIKPENLLLTEDDVLKISDFGMATVFRHQGKERQLERRCGTMPYIAPEILLKSKYAAEPADIWSCGVVLVAMLRGELAWDRPTPDQHEYLLWKELQYEKSRIWKKIDNLVLSLLRKVLLPHPSRRYTLSQIKNHLWCKKKFRDAEGKLLEPELVSPPLKRYHAILAQQQQNNSRVNNCDQEDGSSSSSSNRVRNVSGDENNSRDSEMPVGVNERMCASQPATAFKATNKPLTPTSNRSVNNRTSSSNSGSSCNGVLNFSGFTQPAQMSDLFCGSQSLTQGTQGGSQVTPFQRLVKRMTRFWVGKTPMAETEKFLTSILAKMGYTYKAKNRGNYVIETLDRRGGSLHFRMTLIQVDHRILVDFRLSRGDGLEFKKHFGKIKTNCKEVIEPGPILWPAVVSPDAIPGVPQNIQNMGNFKIWLSLLDEAKKSD